MTSFRHMLGSGAPVIGTWVKTPSPMVTEVLSLTALDCLCLDAEHAPFGRLEMDQCILAARAHGKPVLVRPPSAAPEHILNALDCGATGVILPHIATAEQARMAVRNSHYGAHGRGYAGSSRAAGYTTLSMPRHLERSAETTVVIAQIEDAEALDNIDAIAAVEGLDALFVGRADLTVALGAASARAPEVIAAVEQVCAAGRRHGRTVGMFTGDHAEVPHWRVLGASFFLLVSDHAFMLQGAQRLVDEVRGAA